MSNGKAMTILKTVGLINKTQYKQLNIFQNLNLQEKEWKTMCQKMKIKVW